MPEPQKPTRRGMRSLIRRIEKLEKQLLPSPETAFSRKLLRRMAAANRRMEEYRAAHVWSPPSDEGLPPKRIHTSRGAQRLYDILDEGRQRARLRSLRDKELHETGSLSPRQAGPSLESSSDTPDLAGTNPPRGD